MPPSDADGLRCALMVLRGRDRTRDPWENRVGRVRWDGRALWFEDQERQQAVELPEAAQQRIIRIPRGAPLAEQADVWIMVVAGSLPA